MKLRSLYNVGVISDV